MSDVNANPRWALEDLDETIDLPPDDHHHQGDEDPPDITDGSTLPLENT